MSYTRVFPIFAAAFAIFFALWFLQVAGKSGLPMYWYGWLGTSFLAASAISLAALPLTRRWQPPLWIGWAVPLAVMAVFVYLLRSFFLR